MNLWPEERFAKKFNTETGYLTLISNTGCSITLTLKHQEEKIFIPVVLSKGPRGDDELDDDHSEMLKYYK